MGIRQQPSVECKDSDCSYARRGGKCGWRDRPRPGRVLNAKLRGSDFFLKEEIGSHCSDYTRQGYNQTCISKRIPSEKSDPESRQAVGRKTSMRLLQCLCLLRQGSDSACWEFTGELFLPADILIFTVKAGMLDGVHIVTKLPHSQACYSSQNEIPMWPNHLGEVSVPRRLHSFAKQFPVMTPWLVF